MKEKIVNFSAALLIAIMFLLSFSSYLGDSLTMDELSHIPAGYSYLSQKDYRINQAHHPLIQDLAAIPLLFLKINFHSDSPSWSDPKEVNSQWWFGEELMYNYGNNADQIIFWARLPMILLLIFLAWFIFRWTKKEFGNWVAIFVLMLFVFSPNFLAHGHLVTTDIGATLGLVLATYFWLNFIKKPSIKNVIIAGLALGVALCLKFSLILLIPFFGIITLVYLFLKKENLIKYLFLSVLAGVVAIVFIIYPLYQFHVWNYPPERQKSDTVFTLQSSPFGPLKNLCVWMSDKPILRAPGHYLLGLLMATQRVGSGNTIYFLDKVSAAAWWYYFPVVYFLKNPLSFHVLTFLALILFLFFLIKKPVWVQPLKRLKEWILGNFTVFSMIVFLAIYWFTSIIGKLNLGVRHIFPVFPFTFILVGLAIEKGFAEIKNRGLLKALNILVILLMVWYVLSSLNSYPYFLSYFNEAGGGTKNGYLYAVDSNYDWGQDLKRLQKWVETKKIDKIYVDYFGGGNAKYYLKEKFYPWSGTTLPENFPKGNYLAVSATFLQGGKGFAVKKYDGPTGYYRWLDAYEPVDRAGTSIFIYFIPE